jgi:hypothetical protein
VRERFDPDVLKGKEPWEGPRALELPWYATEARGECGGETLKVA